MPPSGSWSPGRRVGSPGPRRRVAPGVYQTRSPGDQRRARSSEQPGAGRAARVRALWDPGEVPALVRIWEDATCEVHRMVVGPMDNNVYILRCRRSGDALLVDAANEHEPCWRSADTPRGAQRGRDPRPLGPHPGRPGRARGRDLGGGDGRGRRHAPLLRPAARGRRGARGRPPADPHHRHPGPHAGLDVLRRRGHAAPAQRRHPVPRRSGQHRRSRAGTSPRSSGRSRSGCSAGSAPTPWSCPATAPRPPSVRSPPTSRSGSTGAGERRRPGPGRPGAGIRRRWPGGGGSRPTRSPRAGPPR